MKIYTKIWHDSDNDKTRVMSWTEHDEVDDMLGNDRDYQVFEAEYEEGKLSPFISTL